MVLGRKAAGRHQFVSRAKRASRVRRKGKRTAGFSAEDFRAQGNGQGKSTAAVAGHQVHPPPVSDVRCVRGRIRRLLFSPAADGQQGPTAMGRNPLRNQHSSDQVKGFWGSSERRSLGFCIVCAGNPDRRLINKTVQIRLVVDYNRHGHHRNQNLDIAMEAPHLPKMGRFSQWLHKYHVEATAAPVDGRMHLWDVRRGGTLRLS
ncbi:hypothetical protein F4780DRAFT_223155 [Xylariomycetidae sp. FL0641]|nr:hypothetical protein F4780DRAFT_223155 [Xylariomycetidae sp. FL0641]